MNYTIHVKDLGIKIEDKTCWRCGTHKDITNHHAIPVYLNPINNIEIPLCRKCHTDLHGEDLNNVSAFAYKIMKTLKSSNVQIKALTELVNRKQKRGNNEKNIK